MPSASTSATRSRALSRNRQWPRHGPVRPWPGRSGAWTRKCAAASAGPMRHQPSDDDRTPCSRRSGVALASPQDRTKKEIAAASTVDVSAGPGKASASATGSGRSDSGVTTRRSISMGAMAYRPLPHVDDRRTERFGHPVATNLNPCLKHDYFSSLNRLSPHGHTGGPHDRHRDPRAPRPSARSPRTPATRPRSIGRTSTLPPARKLAVLACMDARLTVEDVLGLRIGRGPHHPQRRRPRDRRRDPLAGHQPAAPRHRGGHRHRAHRLRDADVRGRTGAPTRSPRRPAPASTCRSTPFPDLESNLPPRSTGSARTRGSRTCR